MNVAPALTVLAVLALFVLGWKVLKRRGAPQAPREPVGIACPEPVQAADVSFRIQGERGMGGPVYGDVMCADGVYLPYVWEMDLQISADGRWLRTGFYDADSALLVDRQSRRSWVIEQGEAPSLDAMHERLPRWNDEHINDRGMADDAHGVMSDARFDAWLREHLNADAQALVQVRDLWLASESLPEQAAMQPPLLPVAPKVRTGATSDNHQAVLLSLHRHWPASLRNLRDPLAPLQQPHWRLHMDGEPTAWMLDDSHAMVWRDDGQALAMYAYPALADGGRLTRCLVVWTAQQGWQQWDEYLPYDRKAWTVESWWPEGDEVASDDERLRPLNWSGTQVMQSVEMDTPGTERLHDGTSISLTVSSIEGCVGHTNDGRVVTKPIPKTRFYWVRDPAQPEQWRAQSEPVKGKPLVWTLERLAIDEQGETSAWSLQWGDRQLSGSWALEHAIVQECWAVLMPFDAAPERGGAGKIQIWDGAKLQPVNLPWPVMRIRPGSGKGLEIIALTGMVHDKDWDPSTGSWRWPVQTVSPSRLLRPDWRPVYMHREISPDALGIWQILPRWREVDQIQHPCADGDYVWRDTESGDVASGDAASADALWWWGGQNQRVNNYWSEDECRIEGVTMTRSGLALCGTGPCACPHPTGDGWAVQEFVDHHCARPNEWKLHWLSLATKELRTLVLDGNMPLITGWDVQGLHWVDSQPDEGTAAAAQLVTPSMWDKAEVEPLRQAANSLWLRKQDLRYVKTLLAQDDCPWSR